MSISLTASLMSSISSTVNPAIDAIPLAASRRTRDREGSGGTRISIGPMSPDLITDALNGELIGGARNLKESPNFRSDRTQNDR